MPEPDIEMQVHGVNLDMMTNQPVVILKDLSGSRYLPIWIGYPEAQAILHGIQSAEMKRPLTHDLLRSVVEGVGGSIVKIVITDIDDGTFYATIHLRTETSLKEIDARPSDAIALAVRTRSPIFASGSVMEKAGVATEAEEEDEVERFGEWLDNIKPEDFEA